MKKLIITLVAALASTITYAEFSIDISRIEVLDRLKTLTVNDLGVSESGYISIWNGLCKSDDDTINLNKYTVLNTERTQYGTYLKIKRLPLGKVEIESTETKISDKKNTMISIAKKADKLQKCEDDFFVVESIDSAKSISELLDKATTDRVVPEIQVKSKMDLFVEEYTSTEPEPTRTWLVLEDKSPIDDSPQVTLMLSANEEVSGLYGSKNRPTFLIRCEENTTEALFSIGSRLENENVTIRLDSDQAYILEMDKSTNGKALFFPSAISNIKKLLNHDTMIFRFTPSSSGAQTVTFNIADLDTEIAPLREACHW